jgi:hypothetical protein
MDIQLVNFLHKANRFLGVVFFVFVFVSAFSWPLYLTMRISFCLTVYWILVSTSHQTMKVEGVIEPSAAPPGLKPAGGVETRSELWDEAGAFVRTLE